MILYMMLYFLMPFACAKAKPLDHKVRRGGASTTICSVVGRAPSPAPSRLNERQTNEATICCSGFAIPSMVIPWDL